MGLVYVWKILIQSASGTFHFIHSHLPLHLLLSSNLQKHKSVITNSCDFSVFDLVLVNSLFMDRINSYIIGLIFKTEKNPGGVGQETLFFFFYSSLCLK